MAYLGVDTSRIAGTQPLEMLLVSSASPDPHSTIIVDPRTGVSAWSYKGSELQSASTGLVEPLGRSGKHLIITTKDRPLVHVLAVQNKDRFHQKCVLPGPVSAVCTDKAGRLALMSIKKQLYCWLLTTGELLSVTDAHYQNITRIVISDDDSMVFTSSKDGAIHGYLLTDLVSSDRDHTVAPFRKWSSHTLSISDLKITNGSNPRVVSAGADHIACIHSISMDAVILKVSADRPLTAVAIDSAETRIFLGTDIGNIAQINLYQLGAEERDLLVPTGDEHNSKFPVLNGHSEEVRRLAVNTDGTLLASGDAAGKYCIWEIASRQCLKVSTMRSSISTLLFIPYWKTISGSTSAPVQFRPVWDLRREPTKSDRLAVEPSATEFNSDRLQWSQTIEDRIDQLLLEMGTPSSAQLQWERESNERSEAEKAERAAEKATNGVITLGDDEDDAPEVGSKKMSRRKSKGKKKKLQQQQQQQQQETTTTTSPSEAPEHDDDVIVLGDGDSEDVPTKTTSSVEAAVKKELETLRAENERLKEINRQMYEFVAKEIVDGDEK